MGSDMNLKKFSSLLLLVHLEIISILTHQVRGATILTSDMCASFNQEEITEDALDVHSSASEYLLQQGVFTHVVEGYATLNTGVAVGNLTGGGTNTNGAYFTYVLNASVLPDGVCNSVPAHGGGDLCPRSDLFPDGGTVNFMLAPSDAIVFYGCTPPPVNYFGYDFIITTRLTDTYPYYPGTNFQDTLSFRGINVSDDSTDSADGKLIHQSENLKATSSASASVPAPFNRPALLIHTLDSESGSSISEAYQSQAGISPQSISVHQINSDEVKPLNRAEGWKESSPDILGFIHRITMAQDGYEDDFNAFLNMTFPVKVYIAADNHTPGPLFQPVLRSRETGGSSGSTGLPSETELLEGALWDLTNAVMSKYNPNTTTMTGLAISNYTEFDSYDNWDECLDPPSNASWVMGTRDAVYGQSANISMGMVMRNTTAAVLLGAIHTSEGMSNVASYFEAGIDVTNLNFLLDINDHPLTLIGAMRQSSWFQQLQVAGSAARYLPSDYDPSLAEKLFAIDFFPEGYCSEPEYASPWCVEFSSEAINPKLPNPSGLPYLILPQVGERVYSVAASNTGPSQLEALPVRMVGFDFSGPCAQQFSGFRCRSDGVVGYSAPCDSQCDLDSCQYTLWEDSEPYGYLLDALLVCSDNDDGDDDNPLASEFFCDGDELAVNFYDSCESKQCEFVGVPVSNQTYNENHSLDNNAMCFGTGITPGCDTDLVFKIRPCGSSSEEVGSDVGEVKALHPMFTDKFKTIGKQIQTELERIINQRGK